MKTWFRALLSDSSCGFSQSVQLMRRVLFRREKPCACVLQALLVFERYF